jgi:hypothetical protein
MTVSDWAGLVVSVMTAFTALVAGIGWVVKHYLKELTPNGGSSLNDAVKLNILPTIKEIKDDVKHILIEQATIKQKVEDHIEGHK